MTEKPERYYFTNDGPRFPDKLETSQECDDIPFIIASKVADLLSKEVKNLGGHVIMTGHQVGVFLPAPEYVKEVVPRKWLHYYVTADWVHVLHEDTIQRFEEGST